MYYGNGEKSELNNLLRAQIRFHLTISFQGSLNTSLPPT